MFKVNRPVVIAGVLRQIGALVHEMEVDLEQVGAEIRSALVRIADPPEIQAERVASKPAVKPASSLPKAPDQE